MSVFYVSLISGRRTTVGNGNHRHVFFDQIVGVNIVWLARGIVGEGGTRDQDGSDVVKRVTELIGSASAEVEVKEVGVVRVVSTPAEKVETDQLAGVGSLDEGA